MEHALNKSGFGGWGDEKVGVSREAGPLMLAQQGERIRQPKISSTTFDIPRRAGSLALQHTEPVTHLAERHHVSRKFVYQQMAKATTAIDQAFQAPGSQEDKVLFRLPVTKSWLEQLVLSFALYCHSPRRGTMELLDTMFEYRDLSLGSLSNLFQRAMDKARQFNDTEDLSAIRVGGTHQGAVSHEHLGYYLDEYTFRFNRRTSSYRGKLFYRLLQNAVAMAPTKYDDMTKGVRGRKPKIHNM